MPLPAKQTGVSNAKGLDGVPAPLALNLHVFLDEVNEFNGPLWFIPKSHKKGAIEASHDDKGIVWPLEIAPFKVAVVSLRPGDADVETACEAAYKQLQSAGVDTLYDDTGERPGAKFATLELIGIPVLVVVGPKGLAKGVVEIRQRKTGDTEELGLEAAVARVRELIGA